jgi:hypothetical protein
MLNRAHAKRLPQGFVQTAFWEIELVSPPNHSISADIGSYYSRPIRGDTGGGWPAYSTRSFAFAASRVPLHMVRRVRSA